MNNAFFGRWTQHGRPLFRDEIDQTSIVANPPPPPFSSRSYGVPMGQEAGQGGPAVQTPALPPLAQRQAQVRQNFLFSLNRDRALRALRSGAFASLRQQGIDERNAAQQAYAQSQAARADIEATNLGLGDNYFQGRSLADAANARANDLTEANVGLMGAQGNLLGAQTRLTDQTATLGLPAQAKLMGAQAGLATSQGRLYREQAQTLGAQRSFIPLQIGAGLDQAAAESQRTRAEAQGFSAGLPMTQQENKTLRARNQFLESQLNRRLAQNDPLESLLGEGGSPAAAAPTAPASAPPAASPAPSADGEERNVNGHRYVRRDGPQGVGWYLAD